MSFRKASYVLERGVEFGLRAMAWFAAVWFALAFASLAQGQTVPGDRFSLNAGPCTIRSGSGTPASGLGKVCDTYYRNDSPYTIYVKTAASTWTPLLAIDGVSAGSALVSNGTGNPPVYSTSPSLSTSVTAPLLISQGANPSLRFNDQTSAANNRVWDIIATSDELRFRTRNDAISTQTEFISVERTNNTVDKFNLDATLFGSSNFVSQTTGWGIDSAGGGDFRYLFSDEAHFKVFVADLEQALAGGQIIAKSVTILHIQFTCPTAGGTAVLSVKDLPGADNMQVFDVNDWVVIRTFSRASQTLTIGDCVGQVTSPSTSPTGFQTWTFTRGSGGNSGGMSSGTIIPAEAVVIDYGTSGMGYHEINAADGVDAINSPYSQIVTWTTSPVAANRTVRMRSGNLRGVTGVTGEYGIITGTYDTDADARYFRASSSAVELHGVDFRMYDSAVSSGSTPVFRIERGSGTAPYMSLGAPAPTSFSSGTGCWMGDDGGTYKFRCGIPGGDRFEFDGTNVTVSGRLTIGTGRNMLSNTEFRGESSSPFGISVGASFPSDLGGPSTGMQTATNAGGLDSTKWVLGFYNGTGSPQWYWFCNFPSAFPIGGGNCFVRSDTATPSAGSTKQIVGPSIAVASGEFLEFSLYGIVDGHSTSMQVALLYYDSANNSIGAGTTIANAAVTTGGLATEIEDYGRAYIISQVPSGAHYALPIINLNYAGTSSGGLTNVVLTRLYLGYARAGQTEPTLWAPGGVTTIDGSMLSTNMAIANVIRSPAATAIDTGSGFFLNASGTPTFRVGIPGGNRVRWDGTDLTIQSANLTVDASGVRIAPFTTTSLTVGNAYGFNVSNGHAAVFGNDLSTNRTVTVGTWCNACGSPITESSLVAVYNGTGTAGQAFVRAITSSTGGTVSLTANSGAGTNNGAISINGVPSFNGGTSGSAGALAGYINVTVGVTNYRIPVYNP